MPNMITWILTLLKYSAFPAKIWIFLALSLLVEKSVKYMAKLGWKGFTLMLKKTHRNLCFQGWKHQFFSIGWALFECFRRIKPWFYHHIQSGQPVCQRMMSDLSFGAVEETSKHWSSSFNDHILQYGIIQEFRSIIPQNFHHNWLVFQ